LLGLTTAVAAVLASEFRQPVIDDIFCTAATFTGIHLDGSGRAVKCTGSTGHATLLVDDGNLLITQSKNAVRAHGFATAASDAFFRREAECVRTIEISKSLHLVFS
jgi:hypothetical protein